MFHGSSPEARRRIDRFATGPRRVKAKHLTPTGKETQPHTPTEKREQGKIRREGENPPRKARINFEYRRRALVATVDVP